MRIINEGANSKIKCYRVLVRLDKPLVQVSYFPYLMFFFTFFFFLQIPVLEFPLTIRQRTPVRVVHRRGNMIRERALFSLSARARPEDARLVEVDLETSAGLYIKEFVHGEMGRTNPSLASILGARCDFISLDVFDVKLTGEGAIMMEEESE